MKYGWSLLQSLKYFQQIFFPLSLQNQRQPILIHISLFHQNLNVLIVNNISVMVKINEMYKVLLTNVVLSKVEHSLEHFLLPALECKPFTKHLHISELEWQILKTEDFLAIIDMTMHKHLTLHLHHNIISTIQHTYFGLEYNISSGIM